MKNKNNCQHKSVKEKTEFGLLKKCGKSRSHFSVIFGISSRCERLRQSLPVKELFCCRLFCFCRCTGREEHRVFPTYRPHSPLSLPQLSPIAP